jgi:hypothetical protein
LTERYLWWNSENPVMRENPDKGEKRNPMEVKTL